jgi:TorA maturation chaperone TorD
MELSSLSEHEARLRAALYGMLASAFLKEPDPNMIRYFRGSEVGEILKELNLSLGKAFLHEQEEVLIEQLAEEYARLFLVPPFHIPPYESFYVGGLHDSEETFEPSLQGKAAKEVQAFYGEHGLTFSEDSRQLPDHIGIELEALRVLCELEAQSAAQGDGDAVRHCRALARRFLTEHPCRWVPAFGDQIQERTENPFYGVLAQMTRLFIKSELEELASSALDKEKVAQ